MRLANYLPEHFEYFQQRDDARGKPGFRATQKITAALRQLAYSVGLDMLDEYLQMAKKTGRDALNHFCRGVILLYKRRYIRRPTMYDIQRIYEVHGVKHGFPGMLGSLDYMHVGWAMCPTAWRGQFHRGDHPGPTIVLEAVASQDLWIWHAFFGVVRSNNDLNLVNGIYNEWGILVQAYASPVSDKRKYFTKKQGSAMKDIERAFGFLKNRWAMLANPIRFWTRKKITEVVITCIILHNMILEDEGKAICQNYQGDIPRQESTVTNEQRLANINIIKSRELHGNVRHELIEHLWDRRPDDLVDRIPSMINPRAEALISHEFGWFR
ncbi:uncharacterized protein LOC143529891 [Bidens hawaiensis]|uniref:uncharacterized protein LOC143529891 n=1 Tax=Bidens hawaiensis TaxID=980011 RepID=UPI00404992AC